MRNTSKMTTLENRFPLLAVEHGCIISKDADITVAFEVELPELYTVTGAEYEAIHSCWCKAIKVLPDFCVVHKQDWFIKERYKPELQKEDMSFLSRSNERHFNERPYLKHTCYLYLTKTTKERNRMQSNFSTLCRGHIIPKELDRETTTKFLEACEQFERIMNDSGFVPTDDKGGKVSTPINASDIGRGVGYTAVQNRMQKSKQTVKPLIPTIRNKVLQAMRTSPKTEEELRQRLEEQGLRVAIRKNESGRIYGITFIDDKEGSC